MKEKLELIIILATIILAVAIVINKDNLTFEQGEISIEDIIKNTENYLGERNATFTITNVTLRPDPEGILTKTYYLVYIKDSYDFSTPFVIQEDDYQKYKVHSDELVGFKLVGIWGPELMHPPDRLITNILAAKTTDPFHRQYYRVFIYLLDAPAIFKVDLNHDGVVNIIDVAIVAKAFGSRPGDPNWNQNADIDGDGDVDITDIAKVAKEFGKTQ